MKKFFSSLKMPVVVFLGTVVGVLLFSLVFLPKESQTEQANASVSDDPYGGDKSIDCFAGWGDWPKSNILKKDAPWSTILIPFSYYNDNKRAGYNYFDVNGDGLLDVLYSESPIYANGSTKIEECLLLNNGAGWDIAFKCKSYSPDGGITLFYYGDCAQI